MDEEMDGHREDKLQITTSLRFSRTYQMICKVSMMQVTFRLISGFVWAKQ